MVNICTTCFSIEKLCTFRNKVFIVFSERMVIMSFNSTQQQISVKLTHYFFCHVRALTLTTENFMNTGKLMCAYVCQLTRICLKTHMQLGYNRPTLCTQATNIHSTRQTT
jgi:hypothetical protein